MPPAPLISFAAALHINSAPLPHGAPGPESGADTPNLIVSWAFAPNAATEATATNACFVDAFTLSPCKYCNWCFSRADLLCLLDQRPQNVTQDEVRFASAT